MDTLSSTLWRKAYLKARKDAGQELNVPAAQRQFTTADEIVKRFRSQPGVLLCDDVGLGKTHVASLVVADTAARGNKVTVLCPNAAIVEKWRAELEACVSGYASAADIDLAPTIRSIRNNEPLRKIRAKHVLVTTHTKWRNGRQHLFNDLLVVDEAHRGRNDDSQFGAALQSTEFANILGLTATPLSLKVTELQTLLKLCHGRDDLDAPVTELADLINRLWGTNSDGTLPTAAELAAATRKAVDALAPFLIRHSAANVPSELEGLGKVDDEPWQIEIDHVSREMQDLLASTDRALRLGRDLGITTGMRTNDPRHHVGFLTLNRDVECLSLGTSGLPRAKKAPGGAAALTAHLNAIRSNAALLAPHPRIAATVAEVKSLVSGGEKVLVFCHHHDIAAELTEALVNALSAPAPSDRMNADAWQAALREVADAFDWDAILVNPTPRRRKAFKRAVEWLSGDTERARLTRHFPEIATPRRSDSASLACAHSTHRVDTRDSVEYATHQLLTAWLKNPSCVSMLCMEQNPLPAGAVMSVAKTDRPGPYFHNRPDLVVNLFNSPFGPEVLVVTDALSEGIDLHRYCRHLIHHELDASPIRVHQRNGRLRRLGSWSARTDEPLRIAYPSFPGTRDERLVEIVRQRLAQFDLLLGGVPDVDVDDDAIERGEQDVMTVLAVARKELAAEVGRLGVGR